MHDETIILHIHEHLLLHESQYKQKTQHPPHPLHKHTTYNILQHSKAKKNTIFNNNLHNKHSPHSQHNRHKNKHAPYTYIYFLYASSHITPPPHISSSEEILSRLTRRTIAQLRTYKSPFLKSDLYKVDAKSHPSPLCPLWNTHKHDTHHLFNCTHICTTLSPLDLWTYPAGVTALLDRWTEKLLVDHKRQGS